MLRRLVLIATLTSTTLSGQELVTNGGFETGDLSGWTVSTTPSSCATQGAVEAGAAYLGNFGFRGFPFAADCYANGVTTISQILNTTPGQEYSLSFFAEHRAGPPKSCPRPIRNYGCSSAVSIRWDDGFWNYDDPPYFSYHAVPVANRVATSTTSTLSFLFFMHRDDFLFDEISVQAVGGLTTAPEPATVAMLAVGLGVLALSRLSARRSSGQRLG